MKNIAQTWPVESYEWRSPGSTQYKGLHGEASSAWKDYLFRLQVPVYENVGISGGGGVMVLPMMAYTGRIRPKGVSFLCFRYMKE